MLYLASTAGLTSAQDRAVTATKGDVDRTVRVESAAVEGDESYAPIEFVPMPPGTVFEREVVYAEGAYETAGADQLIYSNTLGTFKAKILKNNLIADDITTTVPSGCHLVRYEFPVVGKVNPALTDIDNSGMYRVDFAMYRSCPQSVPSNSRPGLIIAGTQGAITFTDQCKNATDDDGDTKVNDGCAAIGPAETGAQCLNSIDDDGDGKINDGCAAVGAAETDVDGVPRIISFIAAQNIALQTNMWFGVKFSRNNAGVVVGTPALTGFSCDQYDYGASPCFSNAGGFPEQPQASFNLEIFADSACANSYTGYKNDVPVPTSYYNPGAEIILADDIKLSALGCNMIAYEVAIRGLATYSFKMQNNCISGLIAGTERSIGSPDSPNVQILRFTFDPPISLPQNLSFQAKVNNDTGAVIITGQPACIGFTGDRLDTIVNNVCTIVPPDVLLAGYGAINLAITCAGAAPVGACCDMYITDENDDAVCREVPKTNCPFPTPANDVPGGDRPKWVSGGVCEPDPFSPHPCGQAACCKPDGTCQNLTRNECYAVPPLDSPRSWQLGQYCGDPLSQRCPRIACLARTGECTLGRCVLDGGVCDNDRPCVGGLNPGAVCTSDANCRVCSNKKCNGNRVCTNKTCTGNRVCSTKKCNGSPTNTVCTGDGQGTCPAGQNCIFINCTTDTPCLGGTCPAVVTSCTGNGQGTCPPNQTCSFINCTNNTPCTAGGGTCPAAVSVCTDQVPCPPNQTCDFITCISDSPCLANGGTCPTPGGTCGTAPNICTAGLIGKACTFDSNCHCPGSLLPDGTEECQVNPTCCDSCPPIGCENSQCCTVVCDQDVFCCSVEWDDTCASRVFTLCNLPQANDVCAPQGSLEGARLITDVPPSNVTSDSGRASVSANDPGFGCYVGHPGKKGLQTVWYKFYATYDSALLQTCISNSPATDSLIEVFAVGDPTTEATACDSLIPVACGDDFPGCSSGGKNAKVCVQRLIPGNLYYVMVASKMEVADGVAYRLDISAPCGSPPPPPLGDFCADAQTIPNGTTAFNLGDATMTPPVETCIQTMINDKWYKYTATCSGLLTVETCGADPETTPDTNLAIYGSGEHGECLCPPSVSPIVQNGLEACSTDEGGNCGLGSKLVIDVVQGDCYVIRLADVLDGHPSGNLKIACVAADCPAGEFTFTDPPNRVVDAARPHHPNDAASLQGIKTIKATGPRDALASCFTLCETTDADNVIDSVVQNPIGTYTITLHNPITAGALTTITYTDTHGVPSVGRFTSSPGNVNADATTSAADVAVIDGDGNFIDGIIAVLNGTISLVWGNYSGDINRSGNPTPLTPSDILEVVDLINGCSAYVPWDGAPNQSENPCPLP